ncbi:protein adenylyltransferase SelO [Enterovirga rhinocerotis]|nr:YdiU family protein [Enterovirga rhinocerotis]
MTAHFAFDNSYARLPGRFFAEVEPTPVAAPRLVRLNEPLARELGLDPQALASPEGVAILSGQRLPEGAASIAMAYAGHQFGGFVPQLGDGRAILLGEVIDREGRRRDIQLKGAGPTPFSRMGDGRAALGPVLREYLVSEAMHALGIPTTRALAAVATGESIYREGRLPGAVLTRVAASHIRVGTFQFFAVRRDVEGLRLLADHVIARHDPAAGEAENRYRALLEGVIARQAALVARWLLVGFIHGVMNTDNSSISGETIDYGPCAFMDAYDPATVFSSIDRQGRYAYGNQPQIALWNLTRLAETLLPLLADDEAAAIAEAEAALGTFADRFDAAYRAGLCAKLGLAREEDGDADLANGFLALMAKAGADFTLTFRRLCDAAAGPDHDDPMRASLGPDWEGWAARWRERLAREEGDGGGRRAAMRAVNPWVIPRNHRVEAALAAAQGGDLSLADDLARALAQPFEEEPSLLHLAEPPRPEERIQATFCGT